MRANCNESNEGDEGQFQLIDLGCVTGGWVSQMTQMSLHRLAPKSRNGSEKTARARRAPPTAKPTAKRTRVAALENGAYLMIYHDVWWTHQLLHRHGSVILHAPVRVLCP
jgi:hypothetical protein